MTALDKRVEALEQKVEMLEHHLRSVDLRFDLIHRRVDFQGNPEGFNRYILWIQEQIKTRLDQLLESRGRWKRHEQESG
jgi:hypothetical protein